MKRISDKKKIPDFFNNKRYDEHYKNFSVVGLTHEIRDRQNTSYHINSIFEGDYATPITEDDLKNKKFITIKRFITIDGKRVEYTPPPRTIEQIINDSKASYLRWIEGRTEVGFLDHPQLGRVPNMKRPLDILPRLLFDTRPYIQPIKIISDDIEARLEYAHRRNVDEYDEYPAISINLDFSDDAIVADIKKHLKKLRKQLKQRPKLLPPKEFIRKFKNFRTLQVIDILLWQRLTDQHIEYDTLAEFLFPHGQYTGKQLRETIIPFAKKLLNSRSNESAYLFYLSDQSSEK
ncbi:DUF6387 family protein [Acinetobacter johnsonii]|uniref:DUF6387 family protein n=1 Tax=Acinetobacter johnsonii TaxID=40214 RepID=UPI0024483A6B|nr:DUF6387 family protein [Acinetobacter johnsonii]MDH0711255.1 DUF6387 family protein [Acinetobacter johnsonii]MDH1070958.1 DUF6387 family protein [Acinetobacter johnsonii]